jgi:propanol-preferring alcohol dehydrogenase
MKAIRLEGQNKVALREIEDPKPSQGEVLVRVEAAGICRTELHLISGRLPAPTPLTLGHEIVGRVMNETDEFKEGERVVVYYYAGCGKCKYCSSGRENLCPSPRAQYGFITDGGLANYVKVRTTSLVKAPDELEPSSLAPVGCAVTTALHASKKAGIKKGELALVYGLGGVGFPLIQVLLNSGLRVIAVSRNDEKLKLAREMGAEPINSKEDIRRKVRSLGEVDVFFDLVGDGLSQAVKVLGRASRVVYVGYEGKVDIDPLILVSREISLITSVGCIKNELVEAIELVKAGRVKVPTQTIKIEEALQTMDKLKEGNVLGRAVMIPN